MRNVFHDHLDVCEQCRNHPFNLCPVGAIKIREAAEAILDRGIKKWNAENLPPPKEEP